MNSYRGFKLFKDGRGKIFIIAAACLATSCEQPKEPKIESEFDLSDFLHAPDGRRKMAYHLLSDEVLVLRPAEDEQVSASDTWEGTGTSGLTAAVSLCSQGMVIVEPGNNEPGFNYWQVIVQSSGAKMGMTITDPEFADCVSRHTSNCFTIERHPDALELGPLANRSRRIRPSKPVVATNCPDFNP